MSKKLTDYCKATLDLCNQELGEEYFYSSLPLAVIDAVYSIRLSYEQVNKVVDNYCNAYGLNKKETEDGKVHTISELIENVKQFGTDEFADKVLQASYRTAGKESILKADAVCQWAKILQEQGIETFDDFRKADGEKLETKLKSVQGQGEAAVKYLFMLCGDENTCKPDTHLLRFLTDAMGHTVTQCDAQSLLEETVKDLKVDYPNMNVRLLDYIIWDYQRQK